MKQFLLFACLFVSTLSLSAQVYVDIDAADGGDGTSWATAYNDLNLALLEAAPGSSVWIAAGTYVTPDSTSFFIDKELTVLGGFAGDETDAGDADPDANVTILSGDVDGNDGMTFDSLSYVDNNRVLFITDTAEVSAYTVTLDGFTISNGGIAMIGGPDDSILLTSGGGLLTFARLNASRLRFTRNFSELGSAIGMIFPTVNGSVFDDITLEGNSSFTNRQIYSNSVADVTIQNSTFIGNPDEQLISGFCQFAFSNDITVDNCEFSNIFTDFSGPGVRTDQSDDITISNSTFTNCNGSSGGGVYHTQGDDLDTEQDEDDFLIDNCVFTSCSATGRGGAVTGFNTSLKITNSVLTENRAGTIGGAVYQVPIDGRSYTTVFDNVDMNTNLDAGAGGALCLLVFGNDTGNADVVGTVTGSVFSENVSGGGSGGAFYLQGDNSFDVIDSEFSENVGGFGTIITRGSPVDPVDLDVVNTLFENNGNNSQAYQGAGIVGYLDDGSKGITVDNCMFDGNIVTTNPNNITSGGAAIYALGGETEAVPVTITNTTFVNNASADDNNAGAIYTIGGFNLTIMDSEFISNTAGGDGGAMNLVNSIVSRDTADNGDITVNYADWQGAIMRTQFYNQIAGNQGGAISTQACAPDVINSVFVNNAVGSDGASGGAIIFNGNAPGFDANNGVRFATGSVDLEVDLFHNTFVDNIKGTADGAVGDNIALFQPGDSESDPNSMTVNLLNNVFFNSNGAPSIEVELGRAEPAGFEAIGDLTVNSLGGNFYNTELGPNITPGDMDIVNEDFDDASELFVDAAADEEDLPNVTPLLDMGDADSNPLINGGVDADEVPDTDIEGNLRTGTPDIGAYEAQGVTSVAEPIENSGLKVSFFPNPTADVLNIENNEASITNFRVLVADQNGRVLKAANFNGTVNSLDLTAVPAGVYNLQLIVNDNVYSKQVVKQ